MDSTTEEDVGPTRRIDNKCTLIMGEKNSTEKVNTMRLLGAEVIMTKSSAVEKARQIKDENRDNVIMLNQFVNHANPRVHYYTTGNEILDALGEVDVLVAGVGTGGTITGAGQRIKENCPKCTVIAAEPDGSKMFNEHGKAHPFLVEGIGGSTVPIVLDKSVVDGYEVIKDEEAFLMAREVIQKEGLLCGGSSGAAMAAAIKFASKNKLGAGKSIVVVLPDGIRNYMTKFVCEQWMEAHLFMDPPQRTMRWWNHSLNNLLLTCTLFTINSVNTCAQAIKRMAKENIAVIINEDGYFVGAISKDSLRRYLTETSEGINLEDPVTEYLINDCYTLAINDKKKIPTVGLLSRLLDITPFVVVGKNVCTSDGKDHFLPKGVVKASDVFDYILVNQ